MCSSVHVFLRSPSSTLFSLFTSSPSSSRRHSCQPRFVLNSRFNWGNTACVHHHACCVFVKIKGGGDGPCFLPVSTTSRSEPTPVMKSFLQKLQEYDLFMLTCGLLEPRPVSFSSSFDLSRLLPHCQWVNKPRQVFDPSNMPSDFLSSLGIPNLPRARSHSHGHQWADPGRASYL